ncbi:hypothetical protein TDB9533_01102 [Thalassocella blandensis]|nr:hypothetical protein TDB9533_01102 [Thalassocella blandensis]
MKLHSNPMLNFSSGKANRAKKPVLDQSSNSGKNISNKGEKHNSGALENTAANVKGADKKGAGKKGAQALGPHHIQLADQSQVNVKNLSNSALMQTKSDLESRIAQNDEDRDSSWNQAYRKFDAKMDELSDPDKVKSHLTHSQAGLKNKILSPFSGIASSVVHHGMYDVVSDMSNHKFPSAKAHEKLSSMAAKGDVSEYVSLMQKYHHDQIGVDQTKSDKHFNQIGEQLFTDLDKVENEMRARGIE